MSLVATVILKDKTSLNRTLKMLLLKTKKGVFPGWPHISNIFFKFTPRRSPHSCYTALSRRCTGSERVIYTLWVKLAKNRCGEYSSTKEKDMLIFPKMAIQSIDTWSHYISSQVEITCLDHQMARGPTSFQTSAPSHFQLYSNWMKLKKEPAMRGLLKRMWSLRSQKKKCLW